MPKHYGGDVGGSDEVLYDGFATPPEPDPLSVRVGKVVRNSTAALGLVAAGAAVQGNISHQRHLEKAREVQHQVHALGSALQNRAVSVTEGDRATLDDLQRDMKNEREHSEQESEDARRYGKWAWYLGLAAVAGEFTRREGERLKDSQER